MCKDYHQLCTGTKPTKPDEEDDKDNEDWNADKNNIEGNQLVTMVMVM